MSSRRRRAYLAVGALAALVATASAFADPSIQHTVVLGPPASSSASASPSASASASTARQSPPAAYPTSAPAPTGPKPLVITVSGGVSLGAYEAGLLYYLAETIKANPKVIRLELLTGASAGSINSLLTLLDACAEERSAPTASLLYRAWADVGFDQLFVPADVTPTGIFSRHGLEPVIDKMRETWTSGLPETCNAVVGVATTRTTRDRGETAHFPIPLSKVEERFSLHIMGQGQRKPLRVENYVDSRPDLSEPMLPTDASGSVSFDSIRDLLLASSAFPLAFPAQKMKHCSTSGVAHEGGVCTEKNAREDLYIDGGVFDNQPMRLAARLAASGLDRAKDEYVWRKTPDFNDTTLPEGLRFLHVSPDITAYAEDEIASDTKEEEKGVLDVLSNFIASFVDTARSRELASLFEERPDIRDSVTVSHVHLPTMSGLLHAFFGFFERDFREFDFYLGMHDARRLFKDELAARLLGVENERALVYPDPIQHRSDPRNLTGDWQRFACIRGMVESNDELMLACEGADKANFRAMLQTSFDRLYSTCAALASKLVPTTSPHCIAAMDGKAPPRVPGIDPKTHEGWRREKGQTELEHTLSRLTAYGFDFHDLGATRGRQGAAMLQIRRKLGRAISRFAQVQPAAGGAFLRFLAAPALNLLTYAPPDDILYATIGSPIEVGLSNSLESSATLRWNPAIQIRGVGSLLSSDASYFSVAPVVGLEVPVPYANGTFLQTRVGLRAGYIFSTGGGLPFHPCTQSDTSDVGRCSRFTTQLVGELTVYDRLRVHLLFDYLPKLRSSDHALWEITPALGGQLTWN